MNTEIKQNKDPLQGTPDGVEAELKCVVTVFDRRAARELCIRP